MHFKLNIYDYGSILGFICSSSFVIDHLEALSQKESYAVAYIYFDYNEQTRQTPENVFASLIKQLACRLPYLPLKIGELYDDLHMKTKRPTLDDLYTTLEELQRQFPRIFLIFDALDECHEEDQRKVLLPLFQRLGTESGIKLFFTSRPYPEDIKDSFLDAEKIEIYAQEGDIKKFIEEKINGNRRARRLIEKSKCKERIINQLCKCAEGM
jgi:hypothetical protein